LKGGKEPGGFPGKRVETKQKGKCGTLKRGKALEASFIERELRAKGKKKIKGEPPYHPKNLKRMIRRTGGEGGIRPPQEVAFAILWVKGRRKENNRKRGEKEILADLCLRKMTVQRRASGFQREGGWMKGSNSQKKRSKKRKDKDNHEFCESAAS